MDYVNAGTNYQSNNKALRNVIEASGRAVDVFVQAGMPFNVDFSTSKKSDPMMVRGGCVYGVAGEERAAYFTKIVDDAGIECLFDTAVETLLYDEAGVVSGIQCVSGKRGHRRQGEGRGAGYGRLSGSPEETAKHFAGAKIVNMATC